MKSSFPTERREPEIRDRQHAEASAAADLAEHGHLIRLWNVAAADGTRKPLGLYRAGTEAELDELLRALPLASWMHVEVSPLEPHPNDPAGSTNSKPREVEMSSTDVRPVVGTIDMKLEVIVLPVADVDQAKGFYQMLGWRLHADFVAGEDFRVVQMTPPGSPCSIIFGSGITSAVPGSADSLILVVADIEEARAQLVARGVDVSEVFHDAGGVFHHAGTAYRVTGPDLNGTPTARSPRSTIPTATDGCSRK